MKEFEHIKVEAAYVEANKGVTLAAYVEANKGVTLYDALREACLLCLEERQDVELRFNACEYHLNCNSLISYAETMKVQK